MLALFPTLLIMYRPTDVCVCVCEITVICQSFFFITHLTAVDHQSLDDPLTIYNIDLTSPVSQSHFHLSVSPLQMSQKQIMPVEVKINVIGVSLRHIVMLENFELFLLCNMFNNQNKCCWSVWERMSLEVTSENTVSWVQTPQRCQIFFQDFL